LAWNGREILPISCKATRKPSTRASRGRTPPWTAAAARPRRHQGSARPGDGTQPPRRRPGALWPRRRHAQNSWSACSQIAADQVLPRSIRWAALESQPFDATTESATGFQGRSI
jgi:hypothetical protein